MTERFRVSVFESHSHRRQQSASYGNIESRDSLDLSFPRDIASAHSRVDLNLKFEVECSGENMHPIGNPPVLSIDGNELQPRDKIVAKSLRDLQDRVSGKDYPSESFELIVAKDERIALKIERKLPNIVGSFRLWIVDVDRRRKPSSLALEELFSLTDTERKVVIDLVDGLALREIADMREISVNTVRAHMKSIFVKTRTNRQVDLVLLIQQIAADFPENCPTQSYRSS